MKKLVLLVGVAVIFGCGRTSIPSDRFVKECTRGRYYHLIKSFEVLNMLGKGYSDLESAAQQVYQILPDSADYARKNLGRIQIVSITKPEKGKCYAEVKFVPDKTGNELFDSYQSSPFFRGSCKLSFIFDERQHKWLFEDWTGS